MMRLYNLDVHSTSRIVYKFCAKKFLEEENCDVCELLFPSNVEICMVTVAATSLHSIYILPTRRCGKLSGPIE